jgi:regulator of RNase E activity RraA
MDAIAVLREHGTGPVSDALDLCGHDGGLPGPARISGTGTVAGPAYTLRYTPVSPGSPAPAGEFIDDVPPGSVVVVANGGRTTCTVWGDILAEVATANGVVGTVIDGVCRDVADIRRIGYPMWSLGGYMKSGKNRVRLAAIQETVEVCGVRVAPGDVLVCDDAGALAVPGALVERVAELVLRIVGMEDAVRADLAAGVPLKEARARHGYNTVGLVRG